MEQKEREKWAKSGEIASRLLKKAVQLSKPETPLLEIAEKLEAEVEKQKVKLAFPINLSINEIAAHYSPVYGDKTTAKGLLKIDLGVSMDGYISDTSRSVDLTPENKHQYLIKASEEALKEAIKTARENIEVNKIGRSIQQTITQKGFSPIINLSGHAMKRNMLHAGLTIPNYDNKNPSPLKEGIYAIEPFATYGEGSIYDGKPSGIYMLRDIKPVRDAKAREILEFIHNEYNTLPFSSRWLITKFGLRASLALKSLEQTGLVYQFSQLIEKSHMPVSQAEHTILVEKGKISVLTEDNS